jgi:para-nitrobenzyl esterase
MSSIWAKFAHDGNPNIIGNSWQPYTKENDNLMELGTGTTIRHLIHNHDRKLEEIINRHCFKQLDEFNKNKK